MNLWKISSSVFKPRLKLMTERIRLVRKKRGLRAQGDVLLKDALLSIRSNDCRTAKRVISRFLQIVPNIEPDERAIMVDVEMQLPKRDHEKIVTLVSQVLSWLLFQLIKLMSKTPTGYKLSEYNSVYINE